MSHKCDKCDGGRVVKYSSSFALKDAVPAYNGFCDCESGVLLAKREDAFFRTIVRLNENREEGGLFNFGDIGFCRMWFDEGVWKREWWFDENIL